MVPEFRWRDHYEGWLQAERPTALRLLRDWHYRATRGRLLSPGDADSALARAIQEAICQFRLDTNWYFPKQEWFIRWVAITALRAQTNCPIPTGTEHRIPLPILGLLEDDPHRALLLYTRCDDFRLLYDIPKVFDINRVMAIRLRREADLRWEKLLQK
jgi:hypothetical protein